MLIFDLGGGTFDVSILSIADGSMFEVLSTAGDTHLGGEDFDNRMVKHFVSEFKRKYKKDVSGSPRAIRKLKMACEQAKRALSTCSEAAVEIDSFYQGIYFYSRISRARFEEMCIDLFRQTLEPVEKALKDADLQRSDIHEVVLVGGSTRIPKIQNMLKNFFEGKNLNMGINPDEAVAYGAAVQAAVLSEDTSELLKDVLLVDVVPLSLGTDHGEHNGMRKLIERNSRIPVVKSASFSPGRDYQTAVHVGVYQGERALVKDNHMLGEFVFNGLRSARRDEVSVIVEFSMDADGILNVKATEKQTGKSQRITITGDRSRLDQNEIERMLREAEQFRAEDDTRRETIEAMQKLEQYVYAARRGVEEAGNALTDSERQTLTRRSEETIKWMDANTLAEKDEVEQQLRDLQEEFEPILAKMGRQSGAGAGYEGPQRSPPLSAGGSTRPQASRSAGPAQGGVRRGADEDPGTARPHSDTAEEVGDEDVMRNQRAAQELLRGMLGGERGPRAPTHGLWGGPPGSRSGDRGKPAEESEDAENFTPVMDEVD